MEISWYGQTCFRLKERKVTVWTDPFSHIAPGSFSWSQTDIITYSRLDLEKPDLQGQDNGQPNVLDSPGEYEIANVFINSIYLPTAENQSQTARNHVFVIYLDDLAVCNLGYLSHVPSQSQIESLGNIDVLMVPVGGKPTLQAAQAAEVISLVEPQLIIPMLYAADGVQHPPIAGDGPFDSIDKFLKEMGLTNSETVPTLKLTKAQLPEETQVILLEAKV